MIIREDCHDCRPPRCGPLPYSAHSRSSGTIRQPCPIPVSTPHTGAHSDELISPDCFHPGVKPWPATTVAIRDATAHAEPRAARRQTRRARHRANGASSASRPPCRSCPAMVTMRPIRPSSVHARASDAPHPRRWPGCHPFVPVNSIHCGARGDGHPHPSQGTLARHDPAHAPFLPPKRSRSPPSRSRRLSWPNPRKSLRPGSRNKRLPPRLCRSPCPIRHGPPRPLWRARP
jgi:hypothetical protein